MRAGAAGFRGHFATLESAVGGVASVGELQRLRREAGAGATARVPRYGAPLARREGPHWAPLARAWALPFMGSDASVVRRTQRTLVAAGAAGPGTQTLPVQYAAYVQFASFFWMALTAALGALVTFLSARAWGRSLVLAHPGFFSAGAFSHAGPSAAQLAGTSFDITFHARGRHGPAAAAAAAGERARDDDDARCVVRVSGPEPGYVATPLLLLAAAFELLERAEKVPAAGGVLTPAAAFRGPRSTLRTRLESLGVRFEVIES